MHQNASECFRMLQNASEAFRMNQKASECMRMLQNALESFRTLQNASERFRMLQIALECFRMHENASVALFKFGIKRVSQIGSFITLTGSPYTNDFNNAKNTRKARDNNKATHNINTT